MQLSRCRAGPDGPSPGPEPWEPDAANFTLRAMRKRVIICVFSLETYLPRKEVIQPHLPVRLPCYDFTPLTLHTFGASLTRLGRRLRVQTTRVV